VTSSWLSNDVYKSNDYKSKKSDGAINVRGCYTPLRNKLDERLPYREYILRSVSESKGLKTQIKHNSKL
jgi:hypothetical protein